MYIQGSESGTTFQAWPHTCSQKALALGYTWWNGLHWLPAGQVFVPGKYNTTTSIINNIRKEGRKNKRKEMFYYMMVSSTQTLAQIKSQEFIGLIKQHFMPTSPVTFVTNAFKIL